MWRIVPRVVKAAFFGGLYFLLEFYLPLQILPIEEMPWGYSSLFYLPVAAFIIFEVVIKLTSGTIFEHGFAAARAFIIMALLVYLSQGGIMNIEVPLGETFLQVTVDFRIYLVIFLFTSLLGFTANILRAIGYLSEKVEGES